MHATSRIIGVSRGANPDIRRRSELAREVVGALVCSLRGDILRDFARRIVSDRRGARGIHDARQSPAVVERVARVRVPNFGRYPKVVLTNHVGIVLSQHQSSQLCRCKQNIEPHLESFLRMPVPALT